MAFNIEGAFECMKGATLQFEFTGIIGPPSDSGKNESTQDRTGCYDTLVVNILYDQSLTRLKGVLQISRPRSGVLY